MGVACDGVVVAPLFGTGVELVIINGVEVGAGSLVATLVAEGSGVGEDWASFCLTLLDLG